MKDTDLFTIKTTKIPNWENIPTGSKFTAIIGGKKCTGRIYKDEEEAFIYLCQNIMSGVNCNNKLGYRYSWAVNNGTMEEIESCNVKIISITLDPKFKYILPEVTDLDEYSIEYNKDYIKVGCVRVDKKDIQEVLKYMNTLK